MLLMGHRSVLRRPMTMDKLGRRLLARGWLYLPAVSGPIGATMVKLGGGSVWTAAVVGAVPYAVCALPYSAFFIGYVTVLIRWVCGPQTQESMERLIVLSANCAVGLLTLTRVATPGHQEKAEQDGSGGDGSGTPPAVSAESADPSGRSVNGKDATT
jgi:hypothetical protein